MGEARPKCAALGSPHLRRATFGMPAGAPLTSVPHPMPNSGVIVRDSNVDRSRNDYGRRDGPGIQCQPDIREAGWVALKKEDEGTQSGKLCLWPDLIARARLATELCR